MSKYTLFEKEILKSIDRLNFHQNKLSIKVDEIQNRISVLESLVGAPPDWDCYDSFQVCKIAAISHRTLQRWRKDGKIVYRKSLNHYYYPKKDFLEMMDKHLK